MNLFEFLDTYKTNPTVEINKIISILNRSEFVSGAGRYSLKEALDIVYSSTSFASHEPNIDDFLDNVVLKNYNEEDPVPSIINYRYLCEFLLELIEFNMGYDFEEAFESHKEQLKRIILTGLKKSGYVIVPFGHHSVTKKIDEQAEAVASTNIEYSKNIFDYLLAKTIDEKEKVLTSLAIQLEASQPKDKYSKDNREFVQLPRHKDENINSSKYSWFFEENKYEENLDKLFRIYLSIISHDNCYDFIEEFKTNRKGI